jgi:hypothetical protein
MLPCASCDVAFVLSVKLFATVILGSLAVKELIRGVKRIYIYMSVC